MPKKIDVNEILNEFKEKENQKILQKIDMNEFLNEVKETEEKKDWDMNEILSSPALHSPTMGSPVTLSPSSSPPMSPREGQGGIRMQKGGNKERNKVFTSEKLLNSNSTSDNFISPRYFPPFF